jgi:hypothetical protein
MRIHWLAHNADSTHRREIDRDTDAEPRSLRIYKFPLASFGDFSIPRGGVSPIDDWRIDFDDYAETLMISGIISPSLITTSCMPHLRDSLTSRSHFSLLNATVRRNKMMSRSRMNTSASHYQRV